MASIYHLLEDCTIFRQDFQAPEKKKMFNSIIPKTLEIAKSTFFGNLTYMAAPPCDFSTLCSTIPKVMQSKSRWIFKQFLNYVGARKYQGIRMIKRSEMRPLGSATFWDNHLPAVATILTPILVCLKPEILPIRKCHFLWQSLACVRGYVILYVGKSWLSCKRFSPSAVTWLPPTFWGNHLLTVATIFTPFLICLKPQILPIKQPTFEKKI